MTAEDDEVKERLEQRFAEALASRNGESYHDANGNPTTLEKLCRTEPMWAVSRIRHMRGEREDVLDILTAEIGDEGESLPVLASRAAAHMQNQAEAVRLLRPLRGTMEDFAEHDCTYGDGCPPFGSRHGRCTGCIARTALAPQSSEPKPGTLAYVFKDDPAPTPEEHARFLEALGNEKDES